MSEKSEKDIDEKAEKIGEEFAGLMSGAPRPEDWLEETMAEDAQKEVVELTKKKTELLESKAYMENARTALKYLLDKGLLPLDIRLDGIPGYLNRHISNFSGGLGGKLIGDEERNDSRVANEALANLKHLTGERGFLHYDMKAEAALEHLQILIVNADLDMRNAQAKIEELDGKLNSFYEQKKSSARSRENY